MSTRYLSLPMAIVVSFDDGDKLISVIPYRQLYVADTFQCDVNKDQLMVYTEHYHTEDQKFSVMTIQTYKYPCFALFPTLSLYINIIFS